MNLDVEALDISFDAPSATVTVAGVAADQATKEKVLLCCGNVASEAESFSVAGTQALPAAVRGDCGGTRTNCAAHSRD